MRVVLNAVAAKMGGALSYIRNFLSTLAATDRENEYTVFAQSSLVGELSGLAPNIHIEAEPMAERGEMGRVVFDQWLLRRFLKRWDADCLFSTANFGVVWPGVPQIVSVRNPIYYCRRYYEHVREIEGRAAAARVSIRRRMVNLSMRSSDVVVTPSAAMRDMLLEWNAVAARKCVVIHHGFDREKFLSMQGEPSGQLKEQVARRGTETILFYPSLYAKHKNFDTMVKGLDILARRGLDFRVLFVCKIDPAASPYERRTWELIEKLKVGRYITMLGNQPYRNMPAIYRAADLVVWPTFAESFGHPLIETMACGKAAVASDIAVNREMLADAGLYFETFNAEDFAAKVEAALDKATAARLVAAGEKRVNDFSWKKHVASFVDLFAKSSGAN